MDPFGQTRSAQRPRQKAILPLHARTPAPFPKVVPTQPAPTAFSAPSSSPSHSASPYATSTTPTMSVVGTVVSPTTFHLTETGPVDSEVSEGRFMLEFPQARVGSEVRMRARIVDPVTSDVILKWMTVYRDVEGGDPVRSVQFSAL